MKKWKNVTIPNYEELYMVSTDGEVYSVRNEKTLKPKLSKAGYLRVGLANHGKIKMVGVHRLVALAFIENQENKPTVNHINEIKTDNRVENLEWATNAEQNVHGTRIERAVKHTEYKNRGIDYTVVAAKHDYSRSDMCNRKKVEVRKDGILIGVFPTQRTAAKFTGVSVSNVSQCASGQKKSCKGFTFRSVKK